MNKLIHSLFTIIFMRTCYVKANIQRLSTNSYRNVMKLDNLDNLDNLQTFAKGVEKASVDEATIVWMNTVTSYGDTSEQVAELYSSDAVLWGTVSEDVRFTKKDIKNYFEYFANIPGLTVKSGSFKSVVQIFGKRRNIAISSGYYEFLKPDGKGGMISIPARFTFVYRKQVYGNKWEIINHHSSILPKQPGILQNVCSKVKIQKFNALETYQENLRKIANYFEKLKQYK